MVSLGTPVFITVRALTNKLGDDINRGLSGSNRNAQRYGRSLGSSFSRGFSQGVDVNAFHRVANGINKMVPGAEQARKSFASLVRRSYSLGTALTVVVAGASSAVSALGALGGAAIGAGATLTVAGNGLFALIAGMSAVKLATSGVGGALQKLRQQTSAAAATSTRSALQTVRDAQARELASRRIEDAERSLARIIETNRERLSSANQDVAEAQTDLNRAIRAGREELQQLGFEAEDAALSEQRAALELERAREALARVQDLPPNSRIRREAEIAYAEAELNYRQAQDTNADLAAEQERLARTGVNGLASVIDARERLTEAEVERSRVARDALQDEEDAVRDLNEARADAANVDDAQEAAGVGGDTGAPTGAALAAWDEGLNKYQRDFALFLNGLRPKFEELELIAARAFLPKLTEAITILMDKAYPVIAVGIGQVATAMGYAAITLANVITEGQNLDKLATLFTSSAVLIDLFAQSLGSTYDILMSILTVAAPLAETFFGWLNDQLGQFADHLNSPGGKQELIDFFEKAAYTATLFGDVLANVFGGIGAIIDANIGADTGAEFLLVSLRTVTEGFKTADLQSFFLNVAVNAKQVFGSIGDLLGILARLGADQSVGETFAALREGAPALENILQVAVDAGPSFGALVTTITKIISALSDTGAMQVFFDTLNGIFGGILAFVSDPANKEFLDFWGRIFAWFSAVGLVLGGLSTGFRIVSGIVIGLLIPFGGIANVMKVLGPIFTSIGQFILPLLTNAFGLLNKVLLANPIGLIITAIGLLVGSLVWFFTQTEIGRKAWAEFTRFIGEAWENVVKVFEDTIKVISDLFSGFLDWIYDLFGIASPSKVFMDIGQFIIDGFFAGIEDIGRVIGEVFTNMLDFIVDLFLNWTVYGLIIKNWDAIVLFFQATWSTIMGAFDAAFKWIDENVIQPFKIAMQILGIAFEVASQLIQDAWATMQTALVLAWLWIDEHVFNPIKYAVGLVQQAFENVAEGVRLAWDGIKRSAADPINFVIDTVYNNGLRSFWNDIADALNMQNLKLPRVNTIAFAQGGVMPGYSPGRDIHRFYSPTGGFLNLSGGEAIMRPEWTRAVGGPAAVARMNRAARNGQAFASGGVYRAAQAPVRNFANGGVLDFAGDVIDNLAKISKVVADFFADPIGAVKKNLIDGLITPLQAGTGDNLFQQLINNVPIKIASNIGDAVKGFFAANPPQQAAGGGMGWQAMWNIVKSQFPDATLNSALRPGARTVNGGQSYHALGRAIDLPPRMGIFDWLKAAFPNSRELIYSPAGARQLLNGREHLWTGAVKAQHYDHVHWAMAKGGTVYPSRDGSIVRVAEAGRPERVEPLDPNGLSDRDKAMIKLLAGDGRGNNTFYVTQLPGEDGEQLARRVSALISQDMRMGALE